MKRYLMRMSLVAVVVLGQACHIIIDVSPANMGGSPYVASRPGAGGADVRADAPAMGQPDPTVQLAGS